MITCTRLVAVVAGVLLFVGGVAAHPGSGIVVTRDGVVYFVDNSPPPPEGSGIEIVWKLEKNGKLTSSKRGGGHWLALDGGGGFAGVDFADWFKQRVAPNFQRIMPAESFGPSLIACDAQPFVFGRDGNLYYARGNLELARLTPEGKVSVVVPGMLADADRRGGIKGIAGGPDGSIYLSYPGAVQKVGGDGRTSILAENMKPEPGGANGPTELRGLAVDERGIVYVADSGGRRIIKITADGKNSTLLKAEGWIPTGVVVAGDEVFVLEFDDAPPTVWRPRVRKLTTDGKVTVVAEIPARRT